MQSETLCLCQITANALSSAGVNLERSQDAAPLLQSTTLRWRSSAATWDASASDNME
jgi:hypothetical protein